MRIDSRKPKAAALSAALTVALLAGAGATDAHATTLSDTVGSTSSEATLVQPVDYRGDGYGSMQEWNASMGAKRDSLEMRAQIIMNMYGDYATDDERAVLQGCIDARHCPQHIDIPGRLDDVRRRFQPGPVTAVLKAFNKTRSS